MNAAENPTLPPVTPLGALRSPPLRGVLCVLNFQTILKVSEESGIASFQDAIRSTYPELRKLTTHELEIRPDTAGHVIDTPRIVSFPVWQFVDATGDWTVSLSRSSLSVETNGDGYIGRNSLIDRFTSAVEALHAAFDPVISTRLGVRYLNFFDNDKLANIERYVQPNMLGFGFPGRGDGLQSSFTQAEFLHDQATYVVRHGFVETGFANEVMSAPISKPAWLLDIDGFYEPSRNGGMEDVRSGVVKLTNGVCTFFRRSITQQFLEEYGNA